MEGGRGSIEKGGREAGREESHGPKCYLKTLKKKKKGGFKFHISNFKKPNTCPGLLWIPGMFVFSWWNHWMACDSFLFCTIPVIPWLLSPAFFYAPTKANSLRQASQITQACGYWLWYSNCQDQGDDLLDFPNVQQRPKMSLESQCTALSPRVQ